jgi:hypothetical protein
MCAESQTWRFFEVPPEGNDLEFRLFYNGPLPAESSRRNAESPLRMASVKQRIRSAFHPQIKEFWHSLRVTKIGGGVFSSRYTNENLTFWEHYANQHKSVSEHSHIHRFAPMITEHSYYGCSLDVLFLKRICRYECP